jgi:hypothetical protein
LNLLLAGVEPVAGVMAKHWSANTMPAIEALVGGGRLALDDRDGAGILPARAANRRRTDRW